MTISSWRTTAALAPLTLPIVTGQNIIFVPAPMTMTPRELFMDNIHQRSSSLLDEPPCRQRRLEPWRRQIREKCGVEADAHCRPHSVDEKEEEEEDDNILRVLLTNVGNRNPFTESSTLLDLTKEMDSFFDEVFSATPSQHGFDQQSNLSEQGEEEEGEEEEEEGAAVDNNLENVFSSTIENVFSSMLEFSLRAFDEMAAMPLVVDGDTQEEEMMSEDEVENSSGDGLDWEEAEKEDAIPPPPSLEENEEPTRDIDISFDVSPDEEVAGDDNVGITSQPEEAAESFLDFMVATLAQRSAAAAAAASQEQAAAVEESGLPPVQDLTEHLFRLGSNLLSEVVTHRRRLLEGGDDEKSVEDPRLHVQERLARRLTEYRTDLFFSPEDGTITVHTVSTGLNGSGGPYPLIMSPFSSSLMGGGGMVGSSPRPQLGMGTRELDECMSSRFDNRDLDDDQCHEAMTTFYLAVDHREMVPPMTKEEELRSLEQFESILDANKVVNDNYETRSYLFWGMIVLTLALMLDNYFNSDEGGEENEDNNSQADADGFDYGQLPDNDADNERMYVGIPVQVV